MSTNRLSKDKYQTINRIIKHHSKRLRQFACFQETAKEDIEQQLWHDILPSLETYNSQRSGFGTFIYIVVKKSACDLTRQQLTLKRGHGSESVTIDSVEESELPRASHADEPLNQLLQIEFHQCLNKLRDLLPAEAQQILALLPDYNVSDIAKLLHRSHPTISKQRDTLIAPCLNDLLDYSDDMAYRSRNTHYLLNHQENYPMHHNPLFKQLAQQDARKISKLSVDDLHCLQTQIEALLKRLKQDKALLEEALTLKFLDAAKAELNRQQLDAGTVSLHEDSHLITAELRKKVTWDQRKLPRLINSLPEGIRKSLVKIQYSIDERQYLKLPEMLKAIVKDARTVSISKTHFTIEAEK